MTKTRAFLVLWLNITSLVIIFKFDVGDLVSTFCMPINIAAIVYTLKSKWE
jgi:hypothetical protein